MGTVPPNPAFYVTVAVSGKKICKTTTSSSATPTWDRDYEMSVAPSSLACAPIHTYTSRIIEPSSVLSLCLKCFRGKLRRILVVGSVNITTVNLLDQCSRERREPIARRSLTLPISQPVLQQELPSLFSTDKVDMLALLLCCCGRLPPTRANLRSAPKSENRHLIPPIHCLGLFDLP